MKSDKERRVLYNRIMKELSKIVKKSLNEDVNILGVNVKSPIQQKMSDITDLDKNVPFKDKKMTDDIQAIYKKMFSTKYSYFLKENNMNQNIEWSYQIDTACTDGYDGRLIMNPEFITYIFERIGELGVQFIILHETMHNYYNNVRHAQQINSVAANISVDRLINNEIIRRWPEFKDVPTQIGALL